MILLFHVLALMVRARPIGVHQAISLVVVVVGEILVAAPLAPAFLRADVIIRGGVVSTPGSPRIVSAAAHEIVSREPS